MFTYYLQTDTQSLYRLSKDRCSLKKLTGEKFKESILDYGTIQYYPPVFIQLT